MVGMRKDENPRKIEFYFFLGVLIILSFLTFFVFLSFITTLIVSSTVAVVVYPFHKKILKVCRGNKAVASFISIFILTVVILIPLFFITLDVFNEAKGAYAHLTTQGNGTYMFLDTVQQNINKKIAKIVPGYSVNINDYISNASGWVFQNIGFFFSSTLAIAFKIFLGIFALFYFLKDGKVFIESLHDLSPLPRNQNEFLFHKLQISIRSILGGTIIITIIQGLVAGIGYTIFGLPNPALWASLTGLASLVPGLGTSLVLIPSVAYLFVTGSTLKAIGLFVWWALTLTFIDNYLVPRILGRGMNIHPLLVLFSIIGGISFFGPEGFLIGPLTLSFLFAVVELYHEVIKKEE